METRAILQQFASLWKQRYGRSYPTAWAKDGAHVKRLLKLYPFAELLEYVRFYLGAYRSGGFAERAGHSFGVFVSTLPDVIAQKAAEDAKAKRANAAEENFKKLEEARKRRGECQTDTGDK